MIKIRCLVFLGAIMLLVFACTSPTGNSSEGDVGREKEREEDIVYVPENSRYETEEDIVYHVKTKEKKPAVDNVVAKKGEVKLSLDFSNSKILSSNRTLNEEGYNSLFPIKGLAKTSRASAISQAKNEIYAWGDTLVKIRDSLAKKAEVMLVDSASGKEYEFPLDLSSSDIRVIVVPEGTYYAYTTLSHEIQKWNYPSIEEKAFESYDTVRCLGKTTDTINFLFTEKPGMVVFAEITGPYGNWTDGGVYRIDAPAPRELQNATYESGVLKTWAWVDVRNKAVRIRVKDNDSIITLSAFAEIDFTTFADTWTIQISGVSLVMGGIEMLYKQPLQFVDADFYMDCIRMNFNLTSQIRPLNIKVCTISDTTSINGQVSPGDSYLMWCPNDFGFEYVSGQSYIVAGRALSAYGKECTILDTLIFGGAP